MYFNCVHKLFMLILRYSKSAFTSKEVNLNGAKLKQYFDKII